MYQSTNKSFYPAYRTKHVEREPIKIPPSLQGMYHSQEELVVNNKKDSGVTLTTRAKKSLSTRMEKYVVQESNTAGKSTTSCEAIPGNKNKDEEIMEVRDESKECSSTSNRNLLDTAEPVVEHNCQSDGRHPFRGFLGF